MTKTRVPDGNLFWYVKFYNWAIDSITDCGCNDTWAQKHFETGNYFATQEEAEAMARKLRDVLKGADVIEMPSEEEFETMVQDSAHKITCGGHDRIYAADGQGKILDNITYEEAADIIRNILEQLKSKIVK